MSPPPLSPSAPITSSCEYRVRLPPASPLCSRVNLSTSGRKAPLLRRKSQETSPKATTPKPPPTEPPPLYLALSLRSIRSHPGQRKRLHRLPQQERSPQTTATACRSSACPRLAARWVAGGPGAYPREAGIRTLRRPVSPLPPSSRPSLPRSPQTQIRSPVPGRVRRSCRLGFIAVTRPVLEGAEEGLEEEEEEGQKSARVKGPVSRQHRSRQQERGRWHRQYRRR